MLLLLLLWAWKSVPGPAFSCVSHSLTCEWDWGNSFHVTACCCLSLETPSLFSLFYYCMHVSSHHLESQLPLPVGFSLCTVATTPLVHVQSVRSSSFWPILNLSNSILCGLISFKWFKLRNNFLLKNSSKIVC